MPLKPIDVRILMKNIEDAMYALADAQSQLRSAMWMLDVKKRNEDEEADRASASKS